MGGGSGGGTQTTVQKNEAPAYLQPFYTEIANEAQQMYQQGAPAYYPGSTVAPQSAATQQAINSTIARANAGSPLTTAAQGVYQNVLDPAYLDVGKNPYLQGAMNAANEATVRQFQNATAPSILSNFSRAGRLSSDAVGNALGQATDSLGRSIANSNATTSYNAFNQASQNQLNTAAAAPTLANADYYDKQQLATAGAAQDAFAQGQINADIGRYNYDQNSQKLALQDYINLIQGTAGNQGVSTSVGAAPGSNNLLGVLGAAGGVGSLLTGLAAFSDRRLKRDIVRLGTRPDGLGVYEFAYIWNPTERRHGVMADEVVRIKPAAVSRHSSGYLVVDYGAL